MHTHTKHRLIWFFVFCTIASFIPAYAQASQIIISSVQISASIEIDPESLIQRLPLVPGTAVSNDDLTSAVQILQEELLQRGFSFATVQYPDLVPDDKGTFIAVFEIKQIHPDLIVDIDVVGLRYFSNAKLKELLGGLPPTRTAELMPYMQRILNLYLSRGYLFAKVEPDSLIAVENGLKAVIRVSEGKPMRIENFIFEGNKVTRPSTLILLSGLSREKTITPLVLSRSREAIMRKSYLRDCRIEPIDESSILISVQEGKMTFIEGVLGFNENQMGKRAWSGTARLRFLNLWGTDRAIQMYWRSSPDNSSELQFSYHESGSLKYPLAGDLLIHRQVQDSTWVKSRASTDIYYLLSNHKLGIELGLQEISPGFRRPILIDPVSSSSAGILWSYYDTDNAYNPGKGTKQDLRYRYIWGESGSKTALELDSEAYYPIFGRWVGAVALHARNLDDDSPEEFELFKMGGYNSLRGFSENRFSGRRLGWTNYELRFRMADRTRTYMFVDQGFLELPDKRIKTDLFGFGIGIRVNTRLGLLGLDYALSYSDKVLANIGMGMVHMGLEAEL